MTNEDYLKRAAEAEGRAEECESGSVQQRQFKFIADQWRKMAAARADPGPSRAPDES